MKTKMPHIFLSLIIFCTLGFTMLSGCTTVVRTRPPAARIEVRPTPPYPRAVWIPGHWKHKRGHWVWINGHWKQRPGPRAVWVPGHWKKKRWGWNWAPGHWRY